MCYKKWTFFEEWDRPHNIKTWSRPFLCRHQYFLAGNIAEMSPESARESHGNGVLNAQQLSVFVRRVDERRQAIVPDLLKTCLESGDRDMNLPELPPQKTEVDWSAPKGSRLRRPYGAGTTPPLGTAPTRIRPET
jgi:hypothetical protein